MLLGRSRGADAVCFCSELLVRRNELKNDIYIWRGKNQLDEAILKWKTMRDTGFDIKSVNFNKKGFRVNDLKFSDFRVKDPRFDLQLDENAVLAPC